MNAGKRTEVFAAGMQRAALKCARELLEAEAEIERLEQLLVTARSGLRGAYRLVHSKALRDEIDRALHDSDPSRKVEG